MPVFQKIFTHVHDVNANFKLFRLCALSKSSTDPSLIRSHLIVLALSSQEGKRVVWEGKKRKKNRSRNTELENILICVC